MPLSRAMIMVSPKANTQRIPPPSYRHASPSGPWPWMDLESEEESTRGPQRRRNHPKCTHKHGECRCWTEYPQSLFPNWLPPQLQRSKMIEICARSEKCVIHHVDVGDDAGFSDLLRHEISKGEEATFWKTMMVERPENTRVRALFVEDLSVPVMRMLGAKYNIEPFFFTSSVNWIPSRYQEEVQPMYGDHVTITLTFLSVKIPTTKVKPGEINEIIDTQLPLPIPKDALGEYGEWEYDKFLHLDLLAVHMIRRPDSSTIISFHPQPDRRTRISDDDTSDKRTTSARRLHSRVRLAGESVYWQNMFQQTNDPTFVLLTILWYALYAWDEAMEMLWEHICQLESRVINTSDLVFTRELHKIRAHLLHYTSLLEDFRKSVLFVLDTPNPAMDSTAHSDAERKTSRELLQKEANNLLMEIDRLKMSRGMQDKRLKNVMNLAFSTVNIEDSKSMQELTRAAVRDSTAMRQVSYLTMVFLPASFIAAVFGMNVQEITPDVNGTLAHYFEVAFPLTLVTMWVILAFQGKWNSGNRGEVALWRRFLWPIELARGMIKKPEAGSRNNVEKLRNDREVV